jgi:acyl-CoA synthetase (AMP-forming)/AMP-acid ligase II
LGPHDSRIVFAAQRRHYRDNKIKTHGRNMSTMMAMKAGKTATPTDIINFARERIAGFKTPKSVHFIEALPRNASGKILRRHLRDPYWAGKDRQVN